MPQSVEIEGFGTVEFPDEYTQDRISSALDRDVLPRLREQVTLRKQIAQSGSDADTAAAAAQGADRDMAILGEAAKVREYPAWQLNRYLAGAKTLGIVDKDTPEFNVHTPLVPGSALKKALDYMTPWGWDQSTPEEREQSQSVPEGVREGIANVASGFTTPTLENAVLPFTGGSPQAARRLGVAFLPGLFGSVPEQAKELGRATVEGTPRDIARAGTELGVTSAIASHITRGAARDAFTEPARTTPPPLPQNEPPPRGPTVEEQAGEPPVEELVQQLQQQTTEGEPYAVPVEEPSPEVLRGTRPEVGLPPVGEGNTEPQIPPGEEVQPAPAPAAEGGENVLPPLEQPAGPAPAGRPRGPDMSREFSILDDIGAKQISQSSWAEAAQSAGEERFNRRALKSRKLRNLVSYSGGTGLDVILQGLHREGKYLDIENAQQLKSAIEKADRQRIDRAKGQDAEAAALAAEEGVYRAVVEGERPKGSPKAGPEMDTSDLGVGDEWNVNGEPVRVTGIDADGIIRIRGGKTIGDFELQEGSKIRPDKGSFQKYEAEPVGEGEPFDLMDEDRPSSGKSIFEETDEELNSRFRKPTREGVEADEPSVRYRFQDYAEFKQWMDERFGEKDLEGMNLGFKDSPSEFKVKYIRENRSGDALKKEWLSHIATGSPLSAGPPPVRTTARPNPKSMGGSSKPPPPARPGQPPPPPRGPNIRQPFSMMAAVQFLRAFGRFPRINKLLRTARGVYKTATGAVELKHRLTWDPVQALKTLAHETGHFVDLALSPEGKGKDFAKRWQPLRLFRDRFEQKDLRNAARALSYDWRGAFRNGDPYRDKGSELFADAMSAILTKPEWVNQQHPLIYDTFQKLLDDKPTFKAAYDNLTHFLETGRLESVARGQMVQAFKRSREEFGAQEPPEKLSASEFYMKNVVSNWFRAYEKEGRPGPIGDRIIDRLEDSNIEGIRKGSLFGSAWAREVRPLMDKLPGDKEQQHDLVSQWLTLGRIINERKLAGRYIEENPGEGRIFLDRLLKAVPALNSEFRGDLNSIGAGGREIYDLTARVMQRAHDLGERVVKVANQTATDVSPEMAMISEAFNVRGKLLNPYGYDPATAQAARAEIMRGLTPEQRQALLDTEHKIFDLTSEVMKDAYRQQLISDKAWTQIVEPNLYNYVPFAVLDYGLRIGAGIKEQIGTTKDIADPLVALQLKIGALHNWMQRQMQTELLMEAYRRGGSAIAPGDALRGAGALEALRKQHRDDSTSRLPVWRNGRAHVVEFPDDVGKTFEQASERPHFLRELQATLNGPVGKLSRGILATYTTLSPSFLFWRNSIRDMQTSAQRVGYLPALRQTAELRDAWRLSRNYAMAAFGEPMLPEVEAMVLNRTLPPPQVARAFYSDREMLNQLMLSNGLTAMQVSRMRPKDFHPPGKLGEAMHKAERFVASLEALSKIQTYKAAQKAGMPENTAAALGRRGGIPNPAVSGQYSSFLEAWLPWTRVHVQGIRSTVDMLADPQLNKAFAARVGMVEFGPRLARFGIASNLVGRMTNPANQDDTSWKASMGEFFRRVSPYKMALDNIIPLGWHDPRTGEFYPLNHTFGMKSGDIPKHWEAVSFRVPSSEEGKLWGSLLYGMVSGIDKDVSRAGKGIAGNVRDWLVSQGLPQQNPVIEGAVQQSQLWSGKNPDNPFTGAPTSNDELFKAEGLPRVQANVGALLNQLGDAGASAALIAQTMGLLDPRATQPTRSRADKPMLLSQLPVAKSMLAFDNYAQFRDKRNADLIEQRDGARARLLMSPDVRTLYDFAAKYQDKADRKQLDEVDQIRWNAANSWRKYIWGQRDNRRFYAKALSAVGDDGSSGAKTTVQRDLEEASKPFVDSFKAAPTLK